MKCSLSGQSTRILAKAVHSFSRIGSDLYLEANSNGLVLRTVNDSQTAFAVMNFETSFFTDFRIGRSASDEYCNKCKISMKSCMGVFKNMRQVETCQITLNSKASKLLFQFKCMFDTIKTHNVSILEQETLNAVYIANAPNRITAPNKLFTEIIGNFRMYDKEITIEADTGTVVLKNHIETQMDKHLMRTKLALQPQEFQEYHITKPTIITFCLKEFRAILNFADALSLDVTVNFESAGKAVVFAFGCPDATFTTNFVMSTLAPEDMSDSLNKNQDLTTKPCEPNESNMTRTLNISHMVSMKPDEVINLDDGDDVYDLHQPITDVTVINTSTSNTRKEKESNNRDKSRSPIPQLMTLTNSSQNPPPLLAVIYASTSNTHKHKESISRDKSRSTMPLLTTSTNSSQHPPSLLAKETESEEIRVFFRAESTEENIDEEMEIPASPQPERHRRLRKVFPRCFQNTQYAENLSGNILAEMTDDELL